ncbi:MAG: enhanced serine sensitivity protein SseB C-terminal domain-containing protein [Ruminiclostridium sp.]
MAEENIFPNLENSELVAAMAAFKKDPNPKAQSDLVNAALKAKYFAPVEVIDSEGNPLQGTGKMQIPKDAKFNFKLIKNSSGEEFFMLFTDINEFQKWNKNQQIKTIVVVFPQMAQLTMKRSDVVKGFVINPMNENIIFDQANLQNILDTLNRFFAQEQQKEKGENAPQTPEAREVKLYFGKPNNVPDSVLDSLRKHLAKRPEVKAAYFSMMKQDEQEFYLFTLDIEAENEAAKKIADSLCNTAKLFLTKFPVLAAPVNSPYGEGAKRVGEPFYVKA